MEKPKSINTIVKKYLKEIDALKKSGEAREETYYPELKTLLDEVAKFYGREDIINYPSPSNAEWKNPDFKVVSINDIIGYIEAKKPGEDLIKLEKTKQVSEYIEAYNNLITTDFYNLRLYRNRILIKVISLENLKQNKDFDDLFELIKVFFEYSTPKIASAEALAKELATKAKRLKSQIEGRVEKREINYLYGVLNKFLMNDLDHEKFPDLFSQTITYGLFMSKLYIKDGEELDYKNAFNDIPDGINVLREMFTYISTNKNIITEETKWIVDDIVNILNKIDIIKILKEHHDPVIHFYETFLSEYDPESRKSQGVYYTPDPVVSYITKGLNYILKNKFDKANGFADRSVTLLDPASGTMTFMSKAIEIAEQEYPHKGSAKKKWIEEHILKNFYGFEIMMAPYIVGHLRMMNLLGKMGHEIQEDNRFNLYLTNTLAGRAITKDGKLSNYMTLSGLENALWEESELADKVKRDSKILAVLGNPPYSVNSKNKNDFILKLMEDYKKINEESGIRNSKAIQDDYVKFIRFAQHKIDQNGEGVIGFITNHSFIDNITFRGMRHSLMESFNEIYILDLHGNADKHEVCPDGSKDENVFNIKRGVSISFFIKKKGMRGTKVYHSDLWGTEEKKYDWLSKNVFENTEWNEVIPNSPNYFFNPQNEEHREQYELGWKVTDIFPVSSAGIVTARDKLTIQFTEKEMWDVIKNFSTLPEEDAREEYNLGKDTNTSGGWNIKSAQKDLIETGPDKNNITQISYRPFDKRYTYYTSKKGFLKSHSPKVMSHMINKNNVGLLISRQQQTPGFKHIFITNNISEISTVSNRSKEVTYLLPLYNHEKDKKPNIISKFKLLLNETYNIELSPEQILYYIYGVLYSEKYRKKYVNLLKIDFPRIPFTTSTKMFLKMSSLGEQIANLHLMNPGNINKNLSTFNGDDDNNNNIIVQKVKREGKNVYINKNQYFDSIEDSVWEYEIGGYKVLDKWLKSHKGRELEIEDIEHFPKVVTALSETIKIQVEIDKLYPEIEKSIIEYKEITSPGPLAKFLK